MRHRQSILTLLAAAALAAGFFLSRASLAPAPRPATAGNTASGTDADVSTGRTDTHALAPLRSRLRRRPRDTSLAAGSSLPAAGAPLAQTYDDLKARADAGDAQAASRLYHDLRTCMRLQQDQKYLPELSQTLSHQSAVKTASPAQLEAEERHLDSEQRRLDFVRKNQSLCADLSKQQVASVVPMALRAAQLGDEQALDCYLYLNLNTMPDLLDHPQWLDQYKQNAPTLIESGIRSGDWAVVDLLQHAYGTYFTGSLLNQLLDADNSMRYRYLRLGRLGASGADAVRLDNEIAQVEQELNASQITDADAWAEDTYTRFFNDSSSQINLGGTLNACSGGVY